MRRPSLYFWRDESSIRNDNIRFAFMFILFTLFACLTTVVLSIFASNSYDNQTKIFQRHFIHYCILAAISFSLFLIFLIGSLVYTSKSLRRLPFQSPSNVQRTSPNRILKPPLSNSINHKTTTQTQNKSYNNCQTDV